MNRRQFLFTSVAATSVRFTQSSAVTISRITLAAITGRFHKFVAMNAYDKAPKGHTYDNTLIRIGTNQNIEGVGVMAYRASDKEFIGAIRKLIGADPVEIYEIRGGRITGQAPAFAELLNRYRSEEHTSELQSLTNIVCRLLLEKKKSSSTPMTIIL